MLILTLLASTCAVLVSADSLDFFFSANGSCPEIPWACVQGGVLAACGYDTIVDRTYCCGAEAQASCRTGSITCSGNDGGPSSVQQLCTAGQSTWCCLRDTEMCTPRPGQIDVCYALAEDTIGNVSQTLLNDTFSSLSSANPEATSFSLDAASLSAQAATPSTTPFTATSSSSKTKPASSPPPTNKSTTTGSSSSKTDPTSSPPPTNKSTTTGSSDQLSTGAIAGIVIGCAGIIAISAAAYVMFRRQSHPKAGFNKAAPSPTYSPQTPYYCHRPELDDVKMGGHVELEETRGPHELNAERRYELRG